MIITLNYGYYIEVDTYNYTLKQKYDGKTKDGDHKDAVRTCGYYGNIRRCMERYLEFVQKDMLEDEVIELKSFITSIEIINKTALHGLEKEFGKFEVK